MVGVWWETGVCDVYDRFEEFKKYLIQIYIQVMIEQKQNIWEKNKNYRFLPVLYQSLIIKNYLADLDGTQILIYNLKGFTLQTSIDVLTKNDQFCAKIKAIQNRYVIVFGMYTFTIIDMQTLTRGVTIEVNAMIEAVEAKNQYIAAMTSDEEGQNKLIYCWKINVEGKIQKQYKPIQVILPEDEQCTEQKLKLAIIKSIDNNPKIYIFWEGTTKMVEVDPIKNHEQKYNRIKQLTYVTDIDADTYSQISQNKIIICSKKGGKQIGSFINEGQLFKKIYCFEQQTKQYYSVSSKGVKKWKLESNSEPIFYAESDKYNVEDLYMTQDQDLIGINIEKKYIIVWWHGKQISIHNFPNEIIRKIIKLNDKQVCLMLQATISKQVENEVQVEKHNKMEIYDFEKDQAIAKKTVQKLQYKIDIDSSIVGPQNSIVFILNENVENDLKKHIFKWSPFAEEKKKEVKKKQIAGAKNYDYIKLYSFDRTVTFQKPKEVQMYDVFGKSAIAKSQVSILDLNAKKIGDYELSSDVRQVQLSQENQLFALSKDKVSIYEINVASKNRLQKIHELQVSISFICPISHYLLMKKEGNLYVYDKQFDLVMKEDCEHEDDEFRILKIDDSKFILGSKSEFSLWNLESQQKTKLKLPGCDPNLTELIDKHIVIAGKCIKLYDYSQLKE